MDQQDDNPYAAQSAESYRVQPLVAGETLRIDNWWFAVANLVFGRVTPAVTGLEALWSAVVSLASIVSALQNGHTPRRGLCLQLMFSLLCLVMMGILFARRGRGPIVFWCELGDRIAFGRLQGPEEYSCSQVVAFDYEGIGNSTRVAVAHAPSPIDGRRILVISLSSGSEFRLKVRYDQDARLKQYAERVEREGSGRYGNRPSGL